MEEDSALQIAMGTKTNMGIDTYANRKEYRLPLGRKEAQPAPTANEIKWQRKDVPRDPLHGKRDEEENLLGMVPTPPTGLRPRSPTSNADPKLYNP